MSRNFTRALSPALVAGMVAFVPVDAPRAEEPGSEAPAGLELDARLMAGYGDFGFQVFRWIAEEEADGNIFFSGTSLAFALAMALNGAEGETRLELARALGVEGMDLDTFNRANAAWLAALLDAPGDTELAIANSIWARDGFGFEAAFLERNRAHFRAAVEALDFGDPAAVDVINAWVAEHTRGRIDKIVREIGPLDIMFLLNVLYFLGEWTHPFDPQGTSPGSFRLPTGERKGVPMMSLSGTLGYHVGADYQAVRLPYGEDERFAMYLFLPDPGSDLATFYQGLDAAEWERRIAALEPTRLELYMPRFTLEYEKPLVETLEALGIERAFDPHRSDFSALTRARDDVHVSEVLQKTFVQVNEKGTEAAAVTSIRIGVTSMPSHPIIRVDRPFFLAIRDEATGAVLFKGQITDPEDPDREGGE